MLRNVGEVLPALTRLLYNRDAVRPGRGPCPRVVAPYGRGELFRDSHSPAVFSFRFVGPHSGPYLLSPVEPSYRKMHDFCGTAFHKLP